MPEQIPLRDLHLPEAIGWWPLAPGWWMLIAIAAIALAFAVRAWWRVRAHSAARRYALRQLEDIEQQYDERQNPIAFGASLSAFLRRTMLAYAPRQDVAGLTGDEWLRWLDKASRSRIQQRPGAANSWNCPTVTRSQRIPASDMDGWWRPYVIASRRRLERKR